MKTIWMVSDQTKLTISQSTPKDLHRVISTATHNFAAFPPSDTQNLQETQPMGHIRQVAKQEDKGVLAEKKESLDERK